MVVRTGLILVALAAAGFPIWLTFSLVKHRRTGGSLRDRGADVFVGIVSVILFVYLIYILFRPGRGIS